MDGITVSIMAIMVVHCPAVSGSSLGPSGNGVTRGLTVEAILVRSFVGLACLTVSGVELTGSA